MAKKLVCNVESQGMMHQVTVSGNKVTVDGNAPMKIKDLPKEKRKSGSAITIPLSQMDSCILYRSSFTGDSLVHKRLSCLTINSVCGRSNAKVDMGILGNLYC